MTRRSRSRQQRAALALAMVGISLSGAQLAASPDETRSRGPDGFGNIPYGSSSAEAVRLNQGNGDVIANDGPPVLTYRTNIQGLTFNVRQNYDKNRKAVDAIAVATSMEPLRACVARFNHVLALLQATYGQPGSPPLQTRSQKGEIKYTVLIQFSRQNGIEAELTSGHGNSIPGTGAIGKSANSGAGPCMIRLHYLPPGWV